MLDNLCKKHNYSVEKAREDIKKYEHSMNSLDAVTHVYKLLIAKLTH